MKNLKELYRKNIKVVVQESHTLAEAEKNLNLENVYYKSMREYMVLKRMES